MKIFLSYSSKDKPRVMHLAKDLRRVGIDVWIDEWEIQIGDSITQKIQEGVESCDYLAVWLTKDAVASRWVEQEWRNKYKSEIESGKVNVLPLLAEDCDLPLFLRDKRYADFRSNYDEGFSTLIARFERATTSSTVVSSLSRDASLADILVICDSTQWVLNILNLTSFFAGDDMGTLANRKRLNIAKELANAIEIRIAKFSSSHGGTEVPKLNEFLDALRRLIRVSEKVIPPLGKRIFGREISEFTRSELNDAIDHLYNLLPRSGSSTTCFSELLDANTALNAEFVARRHDKTRLYPLIGFATKEEYEQKVDPSTVTLISEGHPTVLAVIRHILQKKRIKETELIDYGYDWLYIESVINSMLKDKFVECDYNEDATTIWLTSAGKDILPELLGTTNSQSNQPLDRMRRLLKRIFP